MIIELPILLLITDELYFKNYHLLYLWIVLIDQVIEFKMMTFHSTSLIENALKMVLMRSSLSKIKKGMNSL